MSPQPTQHRGDILVVDDTPENIRVLSAMLKQSGYRVRAVTSGALALEAVRTEPPDLVLLDVSMPHMDGYEVCRRLKQDDELEGIPVIFLSALSETRDKVEAFSAGGIDYVTKPFRVGEILARIETHLSVRRLQLELWRSNQELQRSYSKLQELERIRQALVQMIVHDLKNPLASIRVNASLIREGGDLEGDLAVAIEDICNVSKVMTRMVVDVLDVTRTEQAWLQPRLAPLDLGVFLEEVAREARTLAQGAGKSFSVRAAPDVPEVVVCDRELLRRVVENILDNSFKYAPRDSEVRLEVARAGPAHYALSVRDGGPGIPEQHREKVFEPYARLERDVEAHAGASRGLGLAFCKMAVEAHRGRIWVESAKPQGSLFVVELPLDPAGAPAPCA